MSDRPGASGMDPTDLWRQWYEMGTRMWQGPMQAGGDSVMDPLGLYRQWFEGMENFREQTTQAMQGGMPAIGAMPSLPGVDSEQAADTWRKAVEATVDGWQKSADMTNELVTLAPRWQEMVEQARDNLMSVEKFPTDPLEFAVQWYNATSGPYSDFVQEMIEREEFLAPASQFLQNYASLYKVFRKNSEEYLRNLQIPTRSDITRVASLIVSLEEKVDNIEEALEEIQDAGDGTGKLEKRLGDLEDRLAKDSDKTRRETKERLSQVEGKLDTISSAVEKPAPSVPDDRIEAIEKRLDGVESKLDRLLDTLENAPAQDAPAAESSESANGSGAAGEVKATAAARRKATDMGVDLTTVTGTGADGQITVDDVRKTGDA